MVQPKRKGTPRTPPKGRPFQKGQSGNPGGRPKVIGEIRELAREYTAEAFETLTQIMGDEDAPAAARVAAVQTILDRGWGKPAQHVEVDVRTAVVDFLASIGPVAAGVAAADDHPLAH